MKILSDKILVEPVDRPKSIGGIALPDSVRDDAHVAGPKEYRVLQVGPGKLINADTRLPMECEVGDRVVCHSYHERPDKLDDGTSIISSGMILMVLPKA